MKMPENRPHQIPDYNSESEKWIDLDGTQSIYLRMIFGRE